MAVCYLEIGVQNDTRFNDIIPVSVQISSLIPDGHDYLFQFMDYQIYKAESPLAEYLSCLDDDKAPRAHLVQSAIVALQQMHPYFHSCRENAVLLVNRAIAGYILRRFPDASEEEQKNLFRKVSVKDYSIYHDPDEIFPTVPDTDDPRILGWLFDLQKEIRRWAFITLDDSNEDLSHVSTARRSALYSLISPYDEHNPMLSFQAHFYTRPSKRMKRMLAQWDFDVLPDGDADNVEESIDATHANDKAGEDSEDKLRSCLDELYWNPGASMPARLREALKVTSDVIGTEADNETTYDCEVISYEIPDFSSLLKLEVYRMLAEEIRIKRCPVCKQYFVIREPGEEACSRLAPHSEMTCSEYWKSNNPQSSSSETAATLQAMYRKAYKTHSARVAKGKMTREAFDQWKTEGQQKKAMAESGKLSIEDFEQWLKK